MVEQETEDLRVGGSIPSSRTKMREWRNGRRTGLRSRSQLWGESSSLSSRTGGQKDVKQRWELVFSLDRYAPVAQMVEQLTLNQRVVGSSPTGRTKTELSSVLYAQASRGRCTGTVRIGNFR